MGKVLQRDALRTAVADLRRAGKKIAFTNGCFDILHVGHVRYLQEARRQGDVLILGLNSDASVRAVKGPARPVVPEGERAEVLAGLACVDYIVLFDEETPASLVAEIQPDVLVKGADWADKTVVGRETVEARGGRVVLIPYVEGASTTHLVEKILRLHGR